MTTKFFASLLAILLFISPLTAVINKKKTVSGKEVFYVYTDEKGAELAKEKVLPNGKSEFVYGFKISGEVIETDENGKVIYLWTYLNNNLEGPAYRFYPSGKKMYELNYVDNVLQGPGKKYYEDGSLAENVAYIDGKIEGIAESYLENGNYYKYSYKNNKLEGVSNLYDSQNRLLESATYKNNTLHGESKKYYLSGVVKSEMKYVMGKPDDYARYYDEKGREVSSIFYRHGKEVNKLQRYENEAKAASPGSSSKQHGQNAVTWQGPAQIHLRDSTRMINEIKFFEKGRNLNNKKTVYYKNGKIRYQGNFTNNRPDGTFSTYSPDGKLLARDVYKNGKLSGTSRLYYASGEKLAEYRYRNGVLEGLSSVYNKDGTLITEVNYKKGLMHGTIKVFYETGELCFEGYFSNGQPVGQLRYYFFNANNKLQHLIEFKEGKISKSTSFSPDGFIEYRAVY